MNTRNLIVAFALATLGLPVAAADELALAQKSGCLACHAAKYRGDKNVHLKLEEKVKKGGVGVWGQVPMTPNSQVSDADIKKLVAWVLSL